MPASDLVSALRPVVAALQRLGIRHFIGGSVASSIHGVVRTTISRSWVRSGMLRCTAVATIQQSPDSNRRPSSRAACVPAPRPSAQQGGRLQKA